MRARTLWIAMLLPLVVMILTMAIFVMMKISNPKIAIGADASSWVHTVFPAVYSAVIYFYAAVAVVWGVAHFWPIDSRARFIASYGIVVMSPSMAMLLPTEKSLHPAPSFSALDLYSLQGFFVPHVLLDDQLYKLSSSQR